MNKGDQHYLITNKHVMDDFCDRCGGHHFRENNPEDATSFVAPISRAFASRPTPADIAVALIPEELWKQEHRNSTSIPIEKFAEQHSPVEREFLFFAGYPQSGSKSLYRHLVVKALPFTTQSPIPEVELDYPEYDFHLCYPRNSVTCLDNKHILAPLASGYSGSLVWNTRFVETLQEGGEWSPESAVVTGIIKRWIDEDGLLVATRVETRNHRTML